MFLVRGSLILVWRCIVQRKRCRDRSFDDPDRQERPRSPLADGMVIDPVGETSERTGQVRAPLADSREINELSGAERLGQANRCLWAGALVR